MRKPCYLLAALVLVATAGCSRPDRITAPERTTAPRYDGGGFMGSGTSVGTPTTTTPADSATEERGGGFMGSGT